MIKLSIITINYNNAEGLRKTLASVVAQTYPNIEHIIVDGNSTDGSVDVIREYESTLASSHSPFASSLKWLSEPDQGIYNAMNKGIEIALGRRIVNSLNRSELVEDKNKPTGDYIQILNSGDLLASNDVTERMVAALRSLENCPPIFYGNMIKEWPDGKRIKDTCGGGDYTPDSFYYFYRGTLNHDCAYIRKDLFEKYGLYNEEMKICSDWEWYVRAIVLGGEKTVYTNIDVTIFDMTGISESDGKNRELIQKERREYLESILPAAVLRDYDMLSLPIEQYRRLKKYHLWGVVYFVERVLFKFEKWGNKLRRK
jgi:glycosyltransferase involved in cell wall biosynthesis